MQYYILYYKSYLKRPEREETYLKIFISKEQLKEKDIQFAEKDKQIENTQKLADQAQQLHAMAEKKIQLLEHKEEVSEEQNKGFFSRLFRQ